jgi:hypothetical protein
MPNAHSDRRFLFSDYSNQRGRRTLTCGRSCVAEGVDVENSAHIEAGRCTVTCGLSCVARTLTCGRSCVAEGVDVVVSAPYVDDAVDAGGAPPT